VPISAFLSDQALWPHNRCARIIFEMNDALALRLDQTGTLNLNDGTIHILFQKNILDSSSGVRAYVFLHALLKNTKRQLNDKMPTPSDIEKSTSIGSFVANMEWYYIQLQTMGVSFDNKTNYRFFLSDLQQKGVEVDQFVDHLDNVPADNPLPKELTLAELILRIKNIHSFQPSYTAINNRYVRPTDGKESSNPHHNQQALLLDSRSNCQPPYDSRSTRDLRTRSDTQCIFGIWGHSVEKCQHMAMHFLIKKYLLKDANMNSSIQISERWHLTNEQYLRSARSTVRSIRSMMPEDVPGRTNYEIMLKFYNEDDAL
jgi:hypothetical protein